MTWSLWQSALQAISQGAASFALNWFVQSSVLILAGLVIGRLLARHGSATQFLVYGTTLVAVLLSPLLTTFVSVAGLTQWSLAMPLPAVMESSPAANVRSTLVAQVSSASSRKALPDKRRFVETQVNSVPAERTDVLEATEAVHSEGFSQAENQASPSASSIRGDAPVAVGGAAASKNIQPTVARKFAWAAWIPFVISGAGVIWLTISTVMLVRLTTSWIRLSGICRRAVLADESTLQLCGDLAKQMKVAAPNVLHTPFLPSPCLAGLLKPAVLLPDADVPLSLRDILIHELAHLRRHDGHWNLLRKLATGVFWFQPLLWMLSRRLEMTAEEVCDDYVMEFGGDRTEYAHRLVDVAEFSSVPMATAAVAMVSFRSMLAQRVARIMDSSRRLSTRTSRRLVVSAFVAGSALTLVLCLLSATPQSIAAQQDDKQPSVANPSPAEESSQPAAVAKVEPEQPAEPLPGLISAPSPLPGNRRWQMYTKHAGSAAEGVCWSPDGRWLAMSQGQIVRLYDFQSGSPEFALVLAGHEDTVKAVRFNADGTRLATTSLDGTVRLWGMDGRQQSVYRKHEDSVLDVSWHPSSERLASASFDGTVQIWSPDGETIAVLSDHEAPVTAVAWNPDGQLLASGCENKVIRYWTADGQPVLTIEGHIGPIRSLAWNADGTQLASCDFGIEATDSQNEDRAHLKIWDRDGQPVNSLLINQPLHSLSWSPDGQHVALGSWRGIKLWKIGDQQPTSQFNPSLNGFIPVAWRPTGELIAGGPMLFDSNGTAQPRIPFRNAALYSAGLNHDGTILGAGRGSRAFDLYSNDGELIFNAPPQPQSNAYSLTCSIGWNAAGTELIPGTRYQRELQRYDAKGEKIGMPITLPGDSRSLEWSKDGRYVAAGGDQQTVVLVDLETSKVVTLGKQGHGITQVKFTPDQQQVCSAGFDGCIRFWSLDGQPLKVFEAISAPICSLAWANGGELLASGHQDNNIRLWSGSGELLSVIGGHGGHVESLEFSPDGTLLASGSRDQSVRLWKRDGTPVAVLQGHAGIVYGLQWSPDGQLLYSAGADGTIRCWNVESQSTVWQTLLSDAGGYVTIDAQCRVKHGDEQVLASDFVFFVEDDQQRLARLDWDQIRKSISPDAITAERTDSGAP